EVRSAFAAAGVRARRARRRAGSRFAAERAVADVTVAARLAVVAAARVDGRAPALDARGAAEAFGRGGTAALAGAAARLALPGVARCAAPARVRGAARFAGAPAVLEGHEADAVRAQ